MTDNLYRWDWGICDTAYFYFKEGSKLFCVEYWADEETVAHQAQYFTIDGDYIENEFKSLSDEEIEEYTKFCKNKIENS